jgi:hypothetical protein
MIAQRAPPESRIAGKSANPGAPLVASGRVRDQRASLDRAESFAAALTRDLARCAALERESMAIIAELTALAHSPAVHLFAG